MLVEQTAYGMRVPFTSLRLSSGARPVPGEIVVFDSPDDGVRLIKRVVAVGGDEVEIRDGRLWRNGRPAAADGRIEVFGERSAPLNLSRGGGPDLGPLRVPEGHVLVVGDFRGNSRDGRMFGTLPESELYGRGLRVFLRSGEGFVWLAL